MTATGTNFFKKAHKETVEEILTYASRGFRERLIKKEICEFYEVKVSYDSDGQMEAHYYPYGKSSVEGYKVRRLPKEFYAVGNIKNSLFGQRSFNGAGKRIVITEGEIDTLSVAQAYQERYQKIYPVVSLQSSTLLEPLIKNRDWVRSFSEIVLCLDSDKNGEEAVKKCINILGFEKIKIAKYPSDCKDPNDVLIKHGHEALLQSIWDAAPYVPAGIISKEKLWEALVEYNNKPAHPYPPCLDGLNTKLKGMRTGEIALFISGTGSGKSTLLREIQLHILRTTTEKVGNISLEEAPAESAKKFAGMALNKNPAHQDIPLEELKVGFDEVFGDDRIIVLDHQGAINDNSIIDQLEYMALMGCKYLVIDHITILVSEGKDDLSGNEAIDKTMNDLLKVVKKHDVWIGLISHLRKAPTGGKSFEEGRMPSIDDIRGSGSIKQISMDIVAFARDMTAEDETKRNTIEMSVLKCRTTGLTGPVKGAYYTHITGRLSAIDKAPIEHFEII